MWTQGLVRTPAQHGLPHPVGPIQQQSIILALRQQSHRSTPTLPADGHTNIFGLEDKGDPLSEGRG